MPSTDLTCAASSLLAGLFGARPVELREAARNRVSVHYETGVPAAPVLTVCTGDAVRLPSSVLVRELPQPGPAVVSRRGLQASGRTWTVTRWWRPLRPRLSPLQPPAPTQYVDLSPASLIGRGPGLTPAGDDVVAGALVAAYALSDPRRGPWAEQTRAALATNRTTVVSRALLHHAIDGYGTPELVAFVDAVTGGDGLEEAAHALLKVGHSSGAALLAGVVHTMTSDELQGVA